MRRPIRQNIVNPSSSVSFVSTDPTQTEKMFQKFSLQVDGATESGLKWIPNGLADNKMANSKNGIKHNLNAAAEECLGLNNSGTNIVSRINVNNIVSADNTS